MTVEEIRAFAESDREQVHALHFFADDADNHGEHEKADLVRSQAKVLSASAEGWDRIANEASA